MAPSYDDSSMYYFDRTFLILFVLIFLALVLKGTVQA
jgi:hypothetical protein